MTPSVTQIWRYPIKAHGREPLEAVNTITGQCLPGDRRWAVAHEASKADNTAWAKCSNFLRGAKAPQLMAMTARYDDEAGLVTLNHPDRPEITFDPDGDAAAFLDWVTPLLPGNRAVPTRIVRVPDRGMTDTDYPPVTLCNLASHRAVETAMGQALSIHRWRGNIWFDLDQPWVENDWVGREVQIGDTVLLVRQRTRRCLATTANPETGQRDAETLKVLNATFGHQDFSVCAEVIQGGRIHLGAAIKVL